jgi:hypothetical protein
MAVHNELIRTSPEYRARRLAIEGFSKGFANARALATSMVEPVLRVPVVVHVLYHAAAENVSDAQVKSQIDVLNRDYRRTNRDVGSAPPPFRPLAADVKVEFVLATTAPGGAATSGITRTATNKTSFDDRSNDAKANAKGGHDPWPSDRYLNMWVVPKLTDPALGDLLGYAQFPGGPPPTDGVVIWHGAFGTTGTTVAPFNQGRTATHEVGHWLNLLHIWGDDNGGCTKSDEVDDTPNQASENTHCPTFPHVSCNNGPNGDMFMNYMDYVDDGCMCMFTKGQATRMRAALSGPRKSLLTSPGLRATVAAATSIGAPQPAAAGGAGRVVGGGTQHIFDGVDWVAPDAVDAQLQGVFMTPEGQ